MADESAASSGIYAYDLADGAMAAWRARQRDLAAWRAWWKAGGNLVTEAGRRVPWPRPSSCYRLASGARVHVKPGCRC